MNSDKEKRLINNPAPLLTLFDYTDKKGNPLTLDKKIELLQQTIRFLSRKDYSSKEEEASGIKAIKYYEIELNYLKEEKEKNSEGNIIEGDEKDVLQKWIKKGLLNKRQKRDCILEIAEVKQLTQEDAFKLAIDSGVNLGNMTKIGSWHKNNLRLKEEKEDKDI